MDNSHLLSLLHILNIEIRQAEPADLDRIKRDLKGIASRSFEQELEEQAQGILSFFLSLDRDKVIGCGFIRWHGPRHPAAQQLFPNAPEIYRLEVHRTFRSYGIGQALMAKMEEAAAAQGYEAVSLGVAHQNWRAYSLYTKLGYADTQLNAYDDEQRYQREDGGFDVVKTRCRYMLKPL